MELDRELPRGTADFPDPVTVHFDGACQAGPTGRIAAYGFVAAGVGLGPHEESALAAPPGSPHATNNVAEYVGAIRALEWLRGIGHRGAVILFGDSELVIRQMKGEYAVRAPHLSAYHHRLASLALEFASVQYRHIPRSENKRADALSKLAVERERRLLAPRDRGP